MESEVDLEICRPACGAPLGLFKVVCPVRLPRNQFWQNFARCLQRNLPMGNGTPQSHGPIFCRYWVHFVSGKNFGRASEKVSANQGCRHSDTSILRFQVSSCIRRSSLFVFFFWERRLTIFNLQIFFSLSDYLFFNSSSETFFPAFMLIIPLDSVVTPEEVAQTGGMPENYLSDLILPAVFFSFLLLLLLILCRYRLLFLLWQKYSPKFYNNFVNHSLLRYEADGDKKRQDVVDSDILILYCVVQCNIICMYIWQPYSKWTPPLGGAI